jgi:hypothetical protein
MILFCMRLRRCSVGCLLSLTFASATSYGQGTINSSATTATGPSGAGSSATVTVSANTGTASTVPVAGAAVAPSPEALADALIAQGVALRAQQRDAEALVLFERANAAFSSARALAQIALAEQALNRWVQAERHLREALAASGDPWIARNSAPLHAALAVIETHLGRLDVLSNVPGAQVWIAAVQVGTIPLNAPLRIAVGSTPVELRAEGYVAQTRTVNITANQTTHESITLTPVPVLAAQAPSIGIDPMAQSKARFVLMVGAGGGSAFYLPTVGVGLRYGFFANRFEMQGRAEAALFWDPFSLYSGATTSSAYHYIGPIVGVDGTFRVRPISGTSPWYAGLGIFAKFGGAFASNPPPQQMVLPGMQPATFNAFRVLFAVGVAIETGLLLGARGQWDLSARFQLGLGGFAGYLTLGHAF